MKLSVFLHLHCADTALSVRFYVSELALFTVSADYGMDTYLVVAKEDPSVGLLLLKGEPATPASRPLFTIAVADIAPLFHRLKDVEFATGAELLTKTALFEYPAGRSMTLKDPGGNIFIIEQPCSA
ncbi:VOC family protein [Xanthomonas medicagonis]|uniref:VOC family protein n=1 Tax=Xanthomonas medicagonis TaxID=3160841 RepID=UPI003517743F